NPVSVDLLMRGDNTAVDGDAVDYHPDQGATPDKLSYTLSFVQNDAPVAVPAIVGGGAISGGGLFGLWSMIGTLLLALHRRLPSVRRKMRFRAVAVIGSVLVVAACGGGGNSVSGSAPANPGSNEATIPNNNPSFVNNSTVSRPSANASFALTIANSLDGTQTIPPVATRAVGATSVALNSVTGALTGKVTHTVSNATGAVIREGGIGQNGAVIATLMQADANTYVIPDNVILTPGQIAAFNAGQIHITVLSPENPDGEIRSQLSNERPVVSLQSTLDDIQTKVFSPTCSGCHTGAGSTLPGIMNLTSADSSYNSLVNTPSLNEPQLDRVSPNDANNSLLIRKLEGTHDVGSQMPFRGKPLDTAVVGAIRLWINTDAAR
ncbi:MAG: CHRD domain-containing protein, partial [Granulosicoccus sp.]